MPEVGQPLVAIAGGKGEFRHQPCKSTMIQSDTWFSEQNSNLTLARRSTAAFWWEEGFVPDDRYHAQIWIIQA